MIQIMGVIRELFTEDTWMLIVFASQVGLAIANFTIAVCLYWIYGRNPELRKFWGVAGVTVAPFAALFTLKGIERTLMAIAIFESAFWNVAAAVDIAVGFVATVCAVCLIAVIRFPDGVRQIIRDRMQSNSTEGKKMD